MNENASASGAEPEDLSPDETGPLHYDLANLLGGGIITAFGLWFGIRALTMNLGTTTNMGPGYFPAALSALCVILGLVLMFRWLTLTAERIDVDWRPLFAVGASLVAFALLMKYLGLIPAIVGTVLVASFGDRDMKILHALILGVAMAVFSWLVFNKGLGLVMPAFKLGF